MRSLSRTCDCRGFRSYFSAVDARVTKPGVFLWDMIEAYESFVVSFVALVANKHILCVWTVADDAFFAIVHRVALGTCSTVSTRTLAHTEIALQPASCN